MIFFFKTMLWLDMDLLCINFTWNMGSPVIGQIQVLFFLSLLWKFASVYAPSLLSLFLSLSLLFSSLAPTGHSDIPSITAPVLPMVVIFIHICVPYKTRSSSK